MDQEMKQQHADTNMNHASTDNSGSTAPDANKSEPSPTIDRLMEQTPALSPFSGWLKCLRGPAISMQYSIQKRHVPNLDAESCRAKNAVSGQDSEQPQKGQNSDVMDVTGGFTIRYFDFALGVLGLMAAGCLLKGCFFLKKKMF